ncbi:MAG: cupin domain-containing protein [Dyadobacter sp.]|uniref:cupin domain-containing protein n=1 Tax=Dyadobacter sp. TaxID=1914288 RepID=UPI003264D80E
MSDYRELIESGILELYILGQTSAAETAQVERMKDAHQEVRDALFDLEVSLENYALSQAKAVDPTIKPFLMATIKYMDRLAAGEKESFPPRLHAQSRIEDYRFWLERPDLSLRIPLDQIDAHIIGASPTLTTAIVWIKNGAPPETHRKELESFLILEGSCNIVVNGQDHHLYAGDIFTIPLHSSHHVLVTSQIPCKLILQRAAVAA